MLIGFINRIFNFNRTQQNDENIVVENVDETVTTSTGVSSDTIINTPTAKQQQLLLVNPLSTKSSYSQNHPNFHQHHPNQQQQQQQQKHHHNEKSNSRNVVVGEIINCSTQCDEKLNFIYLILGILGTCVFVIDVLLLFYVNRVTDVTTLQYQQQQQQQHQQPNQQPQKFNWQNDAKFQMEMQQMILNTIRDYRRQYSERPERSPYDSTEFPYHSTSMGGGGGGGGGTGGINIANGAIIRNERKINQMHHQQNHHDDYNGDIVGSISDGGGGSNGGGNGGTIGRERREASLSIDNMLSIAQSEDPDKKFVEFFNPKIRRELEKKDEEYKKLHGYKGAAPGGDEWVWLTSSCRIPYESITGFCSATKEYCPAGPAGIPGIPGTKGYRGDIGMPGPPGREGIPGVRGPKGMPGSPGLDGRDGVPGEPGLDGVPGRAGADGIPGKDGKDGLPGTDGQNGKDGKDGKEGMMGLQGPPGLPGERGLPGPRGRTGRSGINGTPGIPGINAWKVKVNGTLSSELLIPPSIAGSGTIESTRPIIVHEGDHLRLRCAATGYPKPHVEWRREDRRTINVGAWQATSMPGHTLNITKINRVHMGAYQCLADNGVPPAANTTFLLEVHFAPLIRVRNQHLYVSEGSSVSLECEVEAFPESIKFWKRKSDNRILDQSEKYRIETFTDGYKSTMQLNITNIHHGDYGEYNCVSKNEVNTTTGIFYVNDKSKPPNRGLSDSVAVYGSLPPKRESFEDICGPPTTCPECPDPRDFKCKDTLVTLYDLVGHLEIKPTEDINYPGLPNRTFDCALYAVGKPVYHKFTDQTYGSWLKDPMPRNDEIGEKIWTTNESEHMSLFEYVNKVKYRNNEYKKHTLRAPGFRGNANAIYNGSFYYQERFSSRIVRFDLDILKPVASRMISKAAWNGTNFLYTTEHNYMDFNVDDNGLWVIYSTVESNNTHIVKLDANNLDIQYSWNISINHHKVGEMFIVCGVLYAVDSVVERNTHIRLALDLYRNVLLEDVDILFSNPFKRTTTIGYNFRTKELYTWDKGNQLTYPTRYHEIGYNMTSSEKTDDTPNSEKQTGYEVSHDN